MAKAFVVAETEHAQLSINVEKTLQELGEVVRLDCRSGAKPLLDFFQSGLPADLGSLFLGADLRANAEVMRALSANSIPCGHLWLGEPTKFSVLPSISEGGANESFSWINVKDLEERDYLGLLVESCRPDRSAGVKTFIRPGSTIYSHSFISPHGFGSILDPILSLVKGSLDRPRLAGCWSAINAMVALAVAELPEDTSSGARVELQVAMEADKFSVSLRFPCNLSTRDLAVLQVGDEKNIFSAWRVARSLASFFDVRRYQESNQVEALLIWTKTPVKLSHDRPLLVRNIAQVPLEDAERTAAFKFLPFTSMPGGKRKGIQFRKKAGETEPVSAAPTEANSAAEAATKKLQEKIGTLEATLKQRDELVQKLEKEILEIRDPLKRGVVSSVIDSHKEALQQNVQRLETQLKAAEAREKELIALVDKSIQQKDKYQKELKAMEVKLEQASSGNNSQVVKLQKQLEEANRQRSILSKKIQDMSGKKVA